MATLDQIEIKPDRAENRFRWILHFAESDRPSQIEFYLTDEGAMGLMSALQSLQRKYSIPIPANLRPRSTGRPQLRVVDPPDE